MKATKSKTTTTTKKATKPTTKAASAVKSKKVTTKTTKAAVVATDADCNCDNCLAQTQARRLNTDFKNALFVVSLGVNLILFTLIITAMVSDAYAQQLATFF